MKQAKPECFGKYVFAGASKCRMCHAHVTCKAVKPAKKIVDKDKK